MNKLKTSQNGGDESAATSSEQWQQLCQNAPIGLAVLDLDFRFAQVNESLAAFLHIPIDTPLGRPIADVFPHAAEIIRTALMKVIGSGKAVVGVVLDVGRLDNPRRDCVARADFSPLLDSEGTIVGISCVVIDVTAAATVENELKERLAFEKFLVDLSARFVNLAADKVEAEIHSGLRQLVEFLDVDRSTLWQFLDECNLMVLGSYAGPAAAAFPVGPTRVFDWYQNELRQGKVVRVRSLDELPPESAVEKAYAQSIGLKSHVGIPINVGGLPLCGLGIATFREERSFDTNLVSRLQLVGEIFANAVSRRKADQELRLMQSELSHVIRVSTVGQLAASIAHEINQPLCAIVNNAQAAMRLLASASESDRAEVGEALRDIAADGQRAGEVVARARELLQRRELEFKPIPINEILRDVTALVRSDAIIRRIALNMDLAADLPLVLADRVQIQQVVLNLLINGMDAIGEHSGDHREVLVRTALVDGGAQISVIDSGAGLKPEIAERMFEPFYTTKRDGLGMGLAINRSIVQAHGGRLWAEPNANRGATLAFILPAAPPA